VWGVRGWLCRNEHAGAFMGECGAMLLKVCSVFKANGFMCITRRLLGVGRMVMHSNWQNKGSKGMALTVTGLRWC
jgi:hypothetical protein